MKRHQMAIIVVLCLSLLMLCSCRGSPFAGKWKAVRMVSTFSSVPDAYQEETAEEDGDLGYKITLKSDGTGTMTDPLFSPEYGDYDLEWVETDEGATITLSTQGIEVNDIPCVIEDNQLILDYGGYTMYFEK